MAATPSPVAANADPFPDTIDLPDGFFPEGITIDDQAGYGYVGSLAGAGIQRIDLRTGESTLFAEPIGFPAVAVGMTVDRYGRLWVAAGGSALSPDTVAGYRVYDTATGELLIDQTLVAGFVNDVIVTDSAAWFTDSFSTNLIRVPLGANGSIGEAELVTITGDWVQTVGINANGIAATPDGKNLIVAQTTGPERGTSAIYVLPADIDASSIDVERIMLDQPFVGADGLVLVGRTLYSVGDPGVTKIRLGPGLTSGRILDVFDVPDSITPTTADAFGSRLYVVDAKFPLGVDPATPYHVTVITR